MDRLSPQKIKQFQQHILDWYAQHKRDLPWREVPVGTSLEQKAYRVLVSEVMSQQTQIGRVVPKYEAWLEAFPTVQDLAEAQVGEILRLWSGMGYNRRALNLKKTAEVIVRDYDGKFPQDEKELLKLPGIGEYTARALLCFAFDKQVAVVDTNVRKVILVELCHPDRSDSAVEGSHPTEQLGGMRFTTRALPTAWGRLGFAWNDNSKEIQSIADQLLPVGQAYDWNQALMDYATHVLKKEKIPIPKQSKFMGSHRYYRGQVLKTLLEKKKISLSKLGVSLKKDYDSKWLESLVAELRDEGFVTVKENIVEFVS